MNNVPNAVPGRDNIEIEIFGMEGIPEQDRIAHERAKSGKLDGTFSLGLWWVCGNLNVIMTRLSLCIQTDLQLENTSIV